MWVHLSVEMGSANPLGEEMDKQIQQSLAGLGLRYWVNNGSDLEFWIGSKVWGRVSYRQGITVKFGL